MRTQHRCPKCDNPEVLFIPTPRDARHDQLALGGAVRFNIEEANGQLAAYMCTRCGYVEWYADPRSLDLSKIEGAQVLRAVEPDSPYR
jgi:predicted nucleic-acid-binding Zn-ribbon protein